MTLDAYRVATEWLSALACALRSGDVSAATALFLPDGWLRDLLVLSWDFHTLEGQDKIASYFSRHLEAGQITDLRLDDIQELAPRLSEVPMWPNMTCVEFGFQFDLPRGHGRGVARLVEDDSELGFGAVTVLLALQDLRGDEQPVGLPLKDEVPVMTGKDTENGFAEWVSRVETDPQVLIVGAGQCGLILAERFKQMNIPNLVIEKNARIGDNWRRRYPTLELQSFKRHCTLLHQPYPSTWPEYTPRDEIADWLEQYVTTQGLVVWANSELQAHPQYDERTCQWDVTVIRAGVTVRLHPSHVVFATGLMGRPTVPIFPGLEHFQGQCTHSESFPGGSLFAGKRAVVVGAANSAIDVCQDLAFSGVESVTMVQRSATCVQDRNFLNGVMKVLWPEDEPLEVSDLKVAALPILFMGKRANSIENRQIVINAHEQIFNDLHKGGLRLMDAGCNPYFMFLCTRGDLWLDTGGAALIGNGRIKVESGKSVDYFTETGLVLTDGTELPADVVVFATGYTSMRESNADLLGPEIMQRVGPIGGLDEDGEIRGLFRPCGHPRLWFAGVDFWYSRFFSRQLGLQIKATDSGLLQQHTQTEDMNV